MGKCHYFLATDGSQKFEFCAFRSVRQILLSNYRSVVTGHWKGWKTEQGADGKTKFVAQEYENGDECPGFGKRYTLVEYTVRPGGVGGSVLAGLCALLVLAPTSRPHPSYSYSSLHTNTLACARALPLQCKKEAKGLELVSIAEYGALGSAPACACARARMQAPHPISLPALHSSPPYPLPPRPPPPQTCASTG